MTLDQAIRILDVNDPETRNKELDNIYYHGGFRGNRAVDDAIKEAMRTAVEIMRKYQKEHFVTKPELAEAAINFAMQSLCEGYLDMPSGCEGCPLWSEDDMDDDGNVDCRGNMFRSFIRAHSEEFEKEKET